MAQSSSRAGRPSCCRSACYKDRPTGRGPMAGNINPNPFTTRPEIDGTFGVVASTHWIATAVGMGDPGAGRQRLRRRRRHRVHAAGRRAASERPGRRRAGAALRRAQGKAGADLRPGPRPGRRHHRALQERRPRHGARHRPARRLRARHVRHLDDAAARLRHDEARRRADARDLLCAERPSAGRARQRHHRDGREAVPRSLADLGGGLPAGRQAAPRPASCSPTRRWPRPTRAC